MKHENKEVTKLIKKLEETENSLVPNDKMQRALKWLCRGMIILLKEKQFWYSHPAVPPRKGHKGGGRNSLKVPKKKKRTITNKKRIPRGKPGKGRCR